MLKTPNSGKETSKTMVRYFDKDIAFVKVKSFGI